MVYELSCIMELLCCYFLLEECEKNNNSNSNNSNSNENIPVTIIEGVPLLKNRRVNKIERD